MNVPPDSPLWKNSSSVTSLRLGVVGDEDDLDVAVLGADELVEQEEEAAREVLLHRVHRARRVHDAEDDGVRLLAHVGDDVAVDEVVVVEREARWRRALGAAGDRGAPAPATLHGGDLAPRRARGRCGACRGGRGCRPGGSPCASAIRNGLDLAQRLALEVGQLEVLEHDVDQLFERDVGLVVVDAGLVAGLVLAAVALAACALPTTWPGCESPSPWPTPGALSP